MKREIVAHIPARGGSQRVPHKNIRLLAGKPMIAYAIEAALQSSSVDRVLVNTDSERVASVARDFGAEIYIRKPNLATAEATGDDFTFDIISSLGLDALVMVNPVCPLIESKDIDEVVDTFNANPTVDTVITCSETRMQVAFLGQFLNIDPELPLQPSQVNEPLQILNWAVTVWNADVFLKNYGRNGSGYCGTNRLLHVIDDAKAVKVSYEQDFALAEQLLIAREALRGIA